MKILSPFLLILFFFIYQPSYAEQSFLSVADIHFDPFSSCHVSIHPCKLLMQLKQSNENKWNDIFKQYTLPFATTGEDTNYPLLNTTLAELKHVNQTEKPEFSLIIGDFLAHNFHSKYLAYSHDFSKAGYQLFVKKTMRFLTIQLKNALPNLSIYPVLGNNDSYSGDYHHNSHGIFLQDTATTWISFFNNSNERREFLKDFPNDGYYSISVEKTPHIRIILMNSVLFSINASGKNIKHAATNEIAWLHQQLNMAKTQHQHVILVLHIPPGINVYNTLKKHLNPPETFWHKEYTQLFFKEINEFSANIDAIFPAHIHRDILQLLPIRHIGNTSVYFTPAISPIFGNSPEFRLFTYTNNSYMPNKRIQFIKETHTPNQNHWTRYENTIN